MSNWDELFEYVMKHNKEVHVFGSKALGWVRISWPGSSKMLFKSTATMEEAEKYITHAKKMKSSAGLCPQTSMN